MKKIHDVEAWRAGVYSPGYWTMELPIENPIISGVFDYISGGGGSNIKEIMERALAHLDMMEQVYDVTFSIRILDKERCAMDVFNLKDEYDMMTMIIKYS